MDIFGNFLKQNLINVYIKTDRITQFLKILSKNHFPEHPEQTKNCQILNTPLNIIFKIVFFLSSIYVTKGPYVRKIKIEFCIACRPTRGHSAGQFDTKIRCQAQFLTELLQILSVKTCIMRN